MISLINLMEKKMAAKESKKPSIDKINLENRILAAFSLMEMCKTDAENISAGDLTELYQKVADLNKRAFEDETVFNIVAEHELDQVSNIEQLKEKIRRNRVVSTYKQLGFFALCSGSTKERIPEAPEILATIMHNMGIKTPTPSPKRSLTVSWTTKAPTNCLKNSTDVKIFSKKC